MMFFYLLTIDDNLPLYTPNKNNTMYPPTPYTKPKQQYSFRLRVGISNRFWPFPGDYKWALSNLLHEEL